MKKYQPFLIGALGGIVGGLVIWLMVGRPAPIETVRTTTPAGVHTEATGGAAGLSPVPGSAPGVQQGEIVGDTPGSAAAGTGGADGDYTSTPPQRIDVKNLPGMATAIDNVVVPIPSEIFAVLDRVGRPNWREVIRPIESRNPPLSSQEQVALLLGTVIADGFVAVEAENVPELKQVGQRVLRLSEALGVRQSVVQRSNAIMEYADKKGWARVRKELDGALSDVRSAMMELDSEPLAQLVSLGGWLRGMEALAVVVFRDYTKDAAELLHQPMLVEHFDRRISSMPGKEKSPLITSLHQGLVEIRPLMGTSGDEISPASVETMSGIAEKLVESIHARAE